MQHYLPDDDQLNPWLNHTGQPALGEDHTDLEQLLTAASQLQVPANRSKQEAWEMLSSRLQNEEPTRIPMRFQRPRWYVAAAAALAILVSSGFWLMNRTEPLLIESARAQHKSVELPDGSSVMLNAVSSLRYEPETWEEGRDIYLEGEAFFEVEEGIPFQVITTQGTVRVLGTSFNVYVRENKLEVACYTGKVEVIHSNGLKELLAPGQALQQLNADTSQLDVFDIDKQKIASWKKGKFYFENESLIHVIAVLERQYDVKVDFPGLEDARYTGWFSNQNLELALKTICSPLGIQSEIKQNGHILLRQAATVDVEK